MCQKTKLYINTDKQTCVMSWKEVSLRHIMFVAGKPTWKQSGTKTLHYN